MCIRDRQYIFRPCSSEYYAMIDMNRADISAALIFLSFIVATLTLLQEFTINQRFLRILLRIKYEKYKIAYLHAVDNIMFTINYYVTT